MKKLTILFILTAFLFAGCAKTVETSAEPSTPDEATVDQATPDQTEKPTEKPTEPPTLDELAQARYTRR